VFGASDRFTVAYRTRKTPMLRDVVDGYRSWRRRARSESELGRLDARLRADIGLPIISSTSLIGAGWYAESHGRR